MKHCWPAAHCQLHCCLDDWSIEGLQAFVMPPPCSDSSTLFLSLSLSLFGRATGSFRISPASSSTCAGCAAKGRRPRPISACWRTSKTTSKNQTFTSFNGVHRVLGYAHPVSLSLSLCTSLAYLSAREATSATSFLPTKGTRAFVLLLVIPVDSFSFGFIAT